MRVIQRYELDERIGVGGLAEVFRGTGIERDGSRRPVIVKRILEAFSADPHYVERFWLEARTASILEHPNVVELLEAGRVDGRLFLAFEYVDGADLQRILARVRESKRRLTVGASLHIVYEVLKGLHHVHTRTDDEGIALRIVHRELSPENIVVSRDGEVKLADVGLAKATIRGGRIVSGAIQGDPHYMSPEQLAGTRVDARTDVYAAGMILFTLLAGQHPLYEIPLTALLPQILAGSITPLGKLRPDLPASLSDAVMRAIAPNPADRFASAQELQLSLIEYANDKRIKLEGRKLADFLLTHFPGVELAPPPVPSQSLFTPVVMEARAAEEAPIPEKSLVRTPLRSGIFETGDPAAPRRPSRSRAPTKTARPTVIRDDPQPALKSARRRTTVIRHLDELPPAAPSVPISHIVRTPKRSSPRALATANAPKPALAPDATSAVWLLGHTQGVSSVAFLHDGRHVLSAGHDESVIEWDIVERAPVRVMRGHKGAVTSVAASREGAIAVSGGRDKTVQTWDLGSGFALARLEGHRGWVFSVDVSPDGSRAISGGIDTTVRFWDLTRGRTIATMKGHDDSVSQVVFFADSLRALSGSRDGTLRVWDLESRREEQAFASGADSVRAVAVTRDGRLALSAGAEPVLRLWDLERGVEVHRFEGHREAVAAVAFSPDGKRAVSGGYDGTIRVWDVRAGAALQTFQGHLEPVLTVAFSPAGTHVLSGGADHRVGLWPLKK